MQEQGKVSNDPLRILREQLRTAVLMLLLDSDTLERSSIRALLPEGQVRSRGSNGRRCNVISRNFQQSIKNLADQGLIERTETTVRIIDREALYKFVADSTSRDSVAVVRETLKRWRRLHPNSGQQPTVQKIDMLVWQQKPDAPAS